jgi:NitT/TauT family transport system permease protein
MTKTSEATPEAIASNLSDTRRRWERALIIALGVGAVALWALGAALTSPLILPTPQAVGQALYDISASGSIIKHLWATLKEIVLGFVLGSVIGLGLGILLARSPLLQRLINPYLVASQAMPKLALAPIFTLWFGFGTMPKVVIAALIAFFPLLENTVVGLRAVDRDKIMLFQSLSASEFQIFMKLRLPSARPYIFAGLRVAMLFATVGAIVGEYVGADVGLGAVIIVANGMLDTPLMFAVILFLTALGVVLYKCVEWAELLFQRERLSKFGARRLKRRSLSVDHA